MRRKYLVVFAAVVLLGVPMAGCSSDTEGTNSCANDTRCADENRVCLDEGGKVVCGECVSGYHEEEGSCVTDKTCQPDSCSGHGECDDSSGALICTCDQGYLGDDCQGCDEANGWFKNAAGTGCTNAPLTISISLPSETVYTNSTVTIQLVVGGPAPDAVEVFRDGSALVSLLYPYTYEWDTRSEPEGSHQLMATAVCGDQSASSNRVTVVVDRTSPTFADRIPQPQADNAWIRDPIMATFTEPLLPGTVNASTVVATVDSNLVPVDISLSDGGQELSVSLTQNVDVPAQVSLSLSDNITDLAGNALMTPGNWSFALPFWYLVGGSPLSIDPEAVHIRASLALDSQDQPLVAWSESKGTGEPNLLYIRRWDGSAWQPLGTDPLNLDTTSLSATISVTLDGSDNPVIAWLERVSGDFVLYVSRWDGNDWVRFGTNSLIVTPGNYAFGVKVVVDPDDNPVVAWYEKETSGDGDIYVKRWDGAAWEQLGTGPLDVDPAADAGWPSLALLSTGEPVVAWHEQEVAADQKDIRVKFYDGAAWQQYDNAPLDMNPAVNTQGPALAIDPSDRPVVAWSEAHDSTETHLYVVRREGNQWQPLGTGALNVYSAPTLAQGVSLAIGPDGTPFVSWMEGQAGPEWNASIYMKRFDGDQWIQVGTEVEAAPEREADQSSIAVDSLGYPLVVLRQETGSWPTTAELLVQHQNQL